MGFPLVPDQYHTLHHIYPIQSEDTGLPMASRDKSSVKALRKYGQKI